MPGVEKKDDAGGLHSMHNFLQWSSTGTAADGAAFNVFLNGLNSGGGFAGHTDWRLPKEDGRNGSGQNELETILAALYPCEIGPPCVDAAFNTCCGPPSIGNPGCTVDGAASTPECSCTFPSYYWSDTTWTGNSYYAWEVAFFDGYVDKYQKINTRYVRAVRGGP